MWVCTVTAVYRHGVFRLADRPHQIRTRSCPGLGGAPAWPTRSCRAKLALPETTRRVPAAGRDTLGAALLRLDTLG
jgi:hypothetical protein